MAIGSIPSVATTSIAARNPNQPQSAGPAARTGQALSDQAVSYDPADTNHDGVVSPEEALAYALAHPELASRKAAQAGGTYGTNGTAPTAQAGLLDLKI